MIPFVGVFSLSSKGWLVRFCGESLPLAATAWAATPSSGEASPQRPSSLNPPPAARVASAPPASRHLLRCFRCSFVLTSRRAGPAASPRSIPSTQSPPAIPIAPLVHRCASSQASRFWLLLLAAPQRHGKRRPIPPLSPMALRTSCRATLVFTTSSSPPPVSHPGRCCAPDSGTLTAPLFSRHRQTCHSAAPCNAWAGLTACL